MPLCHPYVRQRVYMYPLRTQELGDNNILVPTDGSKLSQKAEQQAILLAKITGANVIALHIYPKFVGGPYGTYGPAEEILAEAHLRHHEEETGRIFAVMKHLASTARV